MTSVGPLPGWHVDWGKRPYREMHAVQERLVVARAEGGSRTCS